MVKNKEKLEKIEEILEEKGSNDLVIDLFILQEIKSKIEDISDKKLQIELESYLEDLIKIFGERDLDEEAKTEFYCSSCYKFLPLDKRGDTITCKDCLKDEEEDSDYDD